jgi:hypothetical protein
MLCRAESVGVFTPVVPRTVLDRRLIADACRALSERQIAQGLAVRVLADRDGELDAERYRAIFEDIFEQLGDSPVPEGEWPALLDVFSVDELARLLDISPVSLRRYASRNHELRRATPDAVAAKLHFLALVVDSLAGAYNAFGIRRWFERRRTQLDGHAPRELLKAGWAPDDPGPRKVRDLAGALTSLASA